MSSHHPEPVALTIQSRHLRITQGLSQLPWWALVTAALGILLIWSMLTSATYQVIIAYISSGLIVTVRVTLISYTFAVILALIVALGRVSSNVIAHQLATLYVEIIRGVPTLVLMLYVVFVIFPAAVNGLKILGDKMIESNVLIGLGVMLARLDTRQIDNEPRVILALVIAYSAFVAEIFRSGIQSIEPGQMEAARALGMGYWQAMRHVILRQAIRRVLPPLGNDFISMLKDSSLVAALGVLDVTRLSENYANRYFVVLEPYSVLVVYYLVMTLILSMGVKWLERRLAREQQK